MCHPPRSACGACSMSHRRKEEQSPNAATTAAPLKKATQRAPKSSSGRIRNRALQILFGDTPIHWLSKDIAEVPSETVGGRYYVVNLARLTCECGFWRKRKTACKHIVAASEERTQSTGQRQSQGSRTAYRNPRYYDRLRSVRTSCLQEMLRCIRVWVNNG